MQALILEVNRTTWDTTKGYHLAEVADPILDEKQNPEDAERVIVEPLFAGVCGTDKGIWFRKAFKESVLRALEKDHRNYFVAGHEMLGKIIAVGSQVKKLGKLKVGQVVAAESHLYCGYCPMCKAGDFHVCENERILGVTTDGIFAEQVKLPAKVLWPTNLEKIRPEVAALQEPFGNAVHAVTAAGANIEGKSVAIFGCGTIGLFAIMIARALGAKTIIGIEPNAENQKRALACGADTVIPPSENAATAIYETLGKCGADLCLEMSGFHSSILQALKAARRGGDIILFGLVGGDLTIPKFEQFIISGKRMHAVVGRKLFQTWEITQKLLENKANGIQDKIWNIILERGEQRIFPLQKFQTIAFEASIQKNPKTIISIGH